MPRLKIRLPFLDVTAGTVAAGKAVTVDANKDVASFRNVTMTGTLTRSGATGANIIAIPDNLADGLSIKESTNAYLTFVTTDSAEAVNVKKRLTTTDGVTSGTARVVGGRAYTNTAASTAIAASSTETAFDTAYSIPANTLKAGTLVKVKFQGIATATNANDTLTIKLYLATDTSAGAIVCTSLIAMAAQDVSNNDVFVGEYELICRTAGASGTMVGVGTYKSIPAAEGTMTIKDDYLASTTVDTTAAQIVCCTATWSSTNAGNSCRLDFLRVEIY